MRRFFLFRRRSELSKNGPSETKDKSIAQEGHFSDQSEILVEDLVFETDTAYAEYNPDSAVSLEGENITGGELETSEEE